MTKFKLYHLLLGGALSLSMAFAADPLAAAPADQQPVTQKPALSYVNSQAPSWLSLSGEFQFRYEGRQGLGYVEGSPMTGVAIWAIIGPLVAGLGVGFFLAGLKRTRDGS